MACEQRLRIDGRPGGPLMTNSYRLLDRPTGVWALVDPTDDALDLWRVELARTGPPACVLITHGHFDHIGGVAAVRRRYPELPVWAHPDTAPLLADARLNQAAAIGLPCEPAAATHYYREGDRVVIGGSELRVIDAPGHCVGSVMLHGDGQLIAGDVIFQGGVGRWDLPGADYATLARTIRDKVMTLPDDTRIFPGHGPATTVGRERATNPLVREMLARVP
ncbi:MAG TPA: MBL fold metallo-hydrolase [Candidatus Sumerlaeota bacterium]|nr:MBL fold metallo-hydrolase [Candidatus Sumerlaeota bacterium]HPK02435.1 MBL fold metallo-hydrolase [Candidatus Sumerlaeota bacterium]